ncbi:MAG TPA: thiamine-phosphate kinase, partial [Caulifigura sp.]|nr:thiamine-phosphate kinase [Caulifigura sp.]
EFDCPIIGGDTNSGDGPLVINITVLGEPTGRSVVTRAGAEPGDWLFVTGALGGSLPSGRHCTFKPRIREAQALHASASLHSMLDISDGLASDLFHIAEASGVGLELDATAIPIHDDVDRSQPFANRLDHALNDGEDFELLFSVTESDARQLLTGPPPGVQLFTIGRCTESQGVWLRNGNDRTPLTRGGWQHQFS